MRMELTYQEAGKAMPQVYDGDAGLISCAVLGRMEDVRSRTYDTKADGLVGVGLLTPGLGEPGA